VHHLFSSLRLSSLTRAAGGMADASRFRMSLRRAAALAGLVGLLAQTAIAQEAPPPIKRHGPPALLPEPRAMTIGLDFVGAYLRDDPYEDLNGGVYSELKFSPGISGAGWLAAGPGYRRRLLDDRALVDASAILSLRGYKALQGRFELTDLAGGRLIAGSQALWLDLTQLQYFGVGPDSALSSRSDYRLRSADLVGYAIYRATRQLSVEGRLGRLGRPHISSSGGWFDRNYPDAAVTFASEETFRRDRQPGFLHWGLVVTADTRDYPGHPYAGGLYRAAFAGYSDRESGAFSFRRYELEALHFVPLVADRWTFAVHGATILSDTGPGRDVPVYLLPSLGGSSSLRSYENYRFHDRHLLLASAESRVALFRHVDAAVFVDAGGVAGRVGDLALSSRSYGFGLRAHTHSSTTARFDAAWGGEGWRFVFRLNDPFQLTRLARRTAAVPFVP
jgi:hypothetical protein